MKKLLALLLVLVMCVGVLAACKGKTPDGPTLDQAKEYLNSVMKTNNGKATPNDYDVVGKVIVEGTSFEVTWTTNNENITVKASSKANFWTIDVPETNSAEVDYTLTATIKNAAGETVQISFTRKLPVIDSTGVVTDPVAGTAYKLFLDQLDIGKVTLYALNTTQDNNNKFINTTLDPKEAADFYVEASGDGYKIYTEIDGVKNYVHATAVPKTTGNGYTKTIGFATETDSVFVYNSELGTYFVTIDGERFGVGTYGNYNTISISESRHFSVDKMNVAGGQFPVGLMLSSYAETLDPDVPQLDDPEEDSTLTIPEALEVGNSKANGVYTVYKYYVTGVIDEIKSTQYGNLYLKDANGNKIYLYGLYSADGNTKYDAMTTKPVVGDTITVYGVIGKYNDEVQIKSGWMTAHTPGGETPDPDPDPDPNPSTVYNKVTELHNGDKIVIGAPAYNKLLSMVKTGNYNVGIDYTTTDFSNVTNDEIFVVTVNSDGSYTFTSVSGKVLAMQDQYTSLNDTGANNKWEVTAKTGAAEGIFLVKNTVRGTYLEWYNQYGNWSTYSDASDSQFEISFYLVEAGEGGETPDPDPDPDPTPDCEHVDENGDYACDNEGCTELVLPAADSTLTVEQALAIAGKYSSNNWTGNYTSGKYYVSGTIVNVINASKGNFVIEDADGNQFAIYGAFNADGSIAFAELGEDQPLKGDVVTVYGIIGAYGTNVQMNNGWITAHTAHEHDYAAATCTSPEICTICNGTGEAAKGHGEAGEDGLCPDCGEDLNAPTLQETFNIAASEGTLVDKTISWASDNFNFVGAQASSSNPIRTQDTDHYRAYQGSTFAITGNNGQKISKIVITVTEAKYASILEASLQNSGATVTIDGTTVTIELGSADSVNFSATAQFRVKSFVISYKA